MLTITAVIRARKGKENTLRDALLEVAANVQANEPETIGLFHIAERRRSLRLHHL